MLGKLGAVRGVGCQGHWGLAGSEGTQGPAGVEAASGACEAPRVVGALGVHWGPSGGCRVALEVTDGLGA